jgi:hypothetical protein
MNDGRSTVVTQSDLGGIREGSYVRVANGHAPVDVIARPDLHERPASAGLSFDGGIGYREGGYGFAANASAAAMISSSDGITRNAAPASGVNVSAPTTRFSGLAPCPASATAGDHALAHAGTVAAFVDDEDALALARVLAIAASLSGTSQRRSTTRTFQPCLASMARAARRLIGMPLPKLKMTQSPASGCRHAPRRATSAWLGAGYSVSHPPSPASYRSLVMYSAIGSRKRAHPAVDLRQRSQRAQHHRGVIAARRASDHESGNVAQRGDANCRCGNGRRIRAGNRAGDAHDHRVAVLVVAEELQACRFTADLVDRVVQVRQVLDLRHRQHPHVGVALREAEDDRLVEQRVEHTRLPNALCRPLVTV